MTYPGISRNVSALFQISLYCFLKIIADRSLNHVICHQLINLCYSFEKNIRIPMTIEKELSKVDG